MSLRYIPRDGALDQYANFARYCTHTTPLEILTSEDSASTAVLLSDATGVLDQTAAFQSAHDALPASGGTILIPPGTPKVDGTINVTKQVLWQGSGGPGADLVGANHLVTTHGTGTVFNVTARGCAFRDLCILNLAVAPTAGAAVSFTTGSPGFNLFNCGFYGGYQSVSVVNSWQWTITNCQFIGPCMYGLNVSNPANIDAGDQTVLGCVFNLSGTPASLPNSACIYYSSGGGLKLASNKFNGAGAVNNLYFAQVWLNIPDGMNTEDLLIQNNSFENTNAAILQTYAGPANSGTWRNLVITGNQFDAVNYAVNLGGYPGSMVPATPLNQVEIMGNLFYGVNSAITLNAVAAVTIGANHYAPACGTCVALLAQCKDVLVSPQTRHGAGVVHSDASTISNGNLVGIRHQREVITTGNTGVAPFTFNVPNYGGGVLRFSFSGLAQGSGEFLGSYTRYVTCSSAGAVTITSEGGDVQVGTGSNSIGFNVTSAGNNEFQVNVGSVAGLIANCTIEYEGHASLFQVA